MTDSPVTIDLYKSFDVHGDYTTQITLNLVILADIIPQAVCLLLRQIPDPFL
jgi:hypothetical protein